MVNGQGGLEDFRIPTNLKLSLLWASLMFLYIYNDYFSLYTPGTTGFLAGDGSASVWGADFTGGCGGCAGAGWVVGCGAWEWVGAWVC